ncbi:MAG: LpxD N-terminal domain-containing protein, partial [Candidatus Nitrotoga sp.]
MKRADYSLKEIAARFGGRLLGNAETTVNQIATLEKAQVGHLTFLASAKYRPLLATTRASAIIVGTSDTDATPIPRIICDNPYVYFAKVSAFLNPPVLIVPGIHPSAVIEKGVHIDQTAYIGPNVVIGSDTKIGAGCVVMAGCSIGEGVTIGNNSRLYPRVVV